MRRGIEGADFLGVLVIPFVVMIIAVVQVAVVAGGRGIGFVVTDAAAGGTDDAAAFTDPAAVKSLGRQTGNCCQSEQGHESAQGRNHFRATFTQLRRGARGICAGGLTVERNAWTRA